MQVKLHLLLVAETSVLLVINTSFGEEQELLSLKAQHMPKSTASY